MARPGATRTGPAERREFAEQLRPPDDLYLEGAVRVASGPAAHIFAPLAQRLGAFALIFEAHAVDATYGAAFPELTCRGGVRGGLRFSSEARRDANDAALQQLLQTGIDPDAYDARPPTCPHARAHTHAHARTRTRTRTHARMHVWTHHACRRAR